MLEINKLVQELISPIVNKISPNVNFNKLISQNLNLGKSINEIEINKVPINSTPQTIEEAIESLNQYMIGQGMNIEPLPKLILIEDDQDNAKNLLGKTAFYSPSENLITIYTLNRHPKDILRSYPHEMVHREQENEGRLKDIETTNTNEDSNLNKLEEEAYLKGNIIFRNWEDSVKNKISEIKIEKPNKTCEEVLKLYNNMWNQRDANHQRSINQILMSNGWYMVSLVEDFLRRCSQKQLNKIYSELKQLNV